MSEQLPYEECVKIVQIEVNKFKNTDLPKEDLFQDGMVALLKAQQTFNPEKGAKFATYASKVIYNHLVDVIRKHPPVVPPELPTQPSSPTPPIDPEMWEILSKVLATCKPIECEIFKAYLQCLSYDEICAQCAVDKKKVDNTIQKIKKLVKIELDDGN